METGSFFCSAMQYFFPQSHAVRTFCAQELTASERRRNLFVPAPRRAGSHFAMFTKRVVSGFQRRFTVPTGPFLCFAMMTSASFGVLQSLS